MRKNELLQLTPVAFDLQQRMVNLLMFRSNFLKENGLFVGKMGVVLFFACYHKATSESVYETVADELMEQVTEAMHKELPVGFGTGLSGIGWGIEFLLQHGLIEGNGVEICEEIDAKIIEKDPRRITDFSLETGMEGLLHYVLAHLVGACGGQTATPFDEGYLVDLYVAVKSLRERKDIGLGLATLIGKYVRFYETREVIDYKPEITPFLGVLEMEGKQLPACPIGMKDGITGFLFESLKREGCFDFLEETRESNLI